MEEWEKMKDKVLPQWRLSCLLIMNDRVKKTVDRVLPQGGNDDKTPEKTP